VFICNQSNRLIYDVQVEMSSDSFEVNVEALYMVLYAVKCT